MCPEQDQAGRQWSADVSVRPLDSVAEQVTILHFIFVHIFACLPVTHIRVTAGEFSLEIFQMWADPSCGRWKQTAWECPDCTSCLFFSCFLSPSLYVLMNVLHVVRCVINLDSLLFLTLHEQHQCKLLTSLISYSYSFFFSCSLTVKLKLFKDLYLFKSFLSRNFLTCEVRKNVLLTRE